MRREKARRPMTNEETRSFVLPESFPHYPRDRKFHVEHVKIELALDFARKKVSGTCSLRLTGIRSGLDSIELDACGMEIETVHFDGMERKVDYDGEKLTIRGDLSDGKTHLVTVRYSSYPQDGIYFVGPDEKYPDKPVQAWTHS